MKSRRERADAHDTSRRTGGALHALLSGRRAWLKGILTVALLVIWLLTSLPFGSLAHAAQARRQDTFKVILTTSHFGLQFLHVAADNLSDPNGATFSLTNGAILWYGLHVQTSAGVQPPGAADPVNDPVTDLLGVAGLLPPSDIIPINLDGSLFETIKLREAFTAPGQQMALTLTPFTQKAYILDALDILLSLVGMQSSAAFGLLQGALDQILHLVSQVGSLVTFISDLNHLLAAAQVPDAGAALLAANACVDDLIQLFSNKDEVEVLGHIFVLMLGSVASDGVVSAIEGFASAITGIIEVARLGKYLLDFGLSLGAFLFQGDVDPTVTLRSVPANAPEGPSLKTVDWLNHTYTCFPGSPQAVQITVANGVGTSADGQTTLYVNEYPVVYGDVTGDGQPEAMVIYGCVIQGSPHIWTHVWVFTGTADNPALIGDLPITSDDQYFMFVQSVTVLGGDKGMVGPGISQNGSPGCPDLIVTMTYHWSGTQFVLVKLQTQPNQSC